MSRGLLFALSAIAWCGFVLALAGCIAPSEGAGMTPVEAPTWTPTAAAVQTTPVSAARGAQAVALPPAPERLQMASGTPQPTRASARPTPSPTLAAAKREPSPAARTQPTPGERVDVAGPVALPTVAPLPSGEGRPPVKLLIPALNLDAAVEPMGWHVVTDANGTHSEWDVVDNAAGHHLNSAYPGEVGNVVLSGHNNIGGAVFRSVCVIGEPGVDFGLGDAMILVDEGGRRFTYQVNGWQRFPERNASIASREDNAKYMEPTDFAQLTLVTCWPPTSNTHRVIVTGLLTGIEGK